MCAFQLGATCDTSGGVSIKTEMLCMKYTMIQWKKLKASFKSLKWNSQYTGTLFARITEYQSWEMCVLHTDSLRQNCLPGLSKLENQGSEWYAAFWVPRPMLERRKWKDGPSVNSSSKARENRRSHAQRQGREWASKWVTEFALLFPFGLCINSVDNRKSFLLKCQIQILSTFMKYRHKHFPKYYYPMIFPSLRLVKPFNTSLFHLAICS